jgi:glutamate synthase (NADPH) small chain
MGDSRGFLTTTRKGQARRPVSERVNDWKEVYLPMAPAQMKEQAGRCMDCGVPFCHNGCPLGNLIPDWNDLVYRGRWEEALVALHATNNFPEFTGRMCPAPCEESCVLAINDKSVTIKSIEQQIIDRGFEEGWVVAEPPQKRTGKSVAIVGSGPAGLAAAQQLNRAGHFVTVLEKDDKIGGLMRYGIPDFKMDKILLDRRLEQLSEEGVQFRTGVNVGKDLTVLELRSAFDAVLLCIGSLEPRAIDLPGRELDGIHLAMDYLAEQNRICDGQEVINPILATDKHVLIIGGGDTGADCYGTALRQGAKSVTQFQIHPEPPTSMPELNPWWPAPANILRVSAAHEEGGAREWGIHTEKFVGDANNHVRGLATIKVEGMKKGPNGERQIIPVEGSATEFPADLVLIAIGYSHPLHTGLVADLGIALDKRGNLSADTDYQTNVPGVFVAGDARRGQSLIVWAIAEGREAAQGVDMYLMGASKLPLTAYK